jgi:hypothetical protein
MRIKEVRIYDACSSALNAKLHSPLVAKNDHRSKRNIFTSSTKTLTSQARRMV